MEVHGELRDLIELGLGRWEVPFDTQHRREPALFRQQVFGLRCGLRRWQDGTSSELLFFDLYLYGFWKGVQYPLGELIWCLPMLTSCTSPWCVDEGVSHSLIGFVQTAATEVSCSGDWAADWSGGPNCLQRPTGLEA